MTKLIAIDSKTNRTLGTLNNRGKKIIFSGEYVRLMEGRHALTFTMPSDIKEAEHFAKRQRFLYPTEDKGFEEFIIFETVTSMDKRKTVLGTAAYTELDTAFIVNPGKYQGTLQEIVSSVLPIKRYQLGRFEDFSQGTVQIDEHIGGYAFLVKVAKAFGLEMQVRIEIGEGNVFLGRFIDFVKRIGPASKKVIELGKDLLDVEITEHSGQIATRLMGIGPTRSDGSYLVSYAESEEAFQLWNDEGEHITRIYKPDTADQDMTQERLDQLTETELKKRIAAIYDYHVEAVDIEKQYPHEKVRFGSPLRVKNIEFNPPLYAEARVIGIRKSIVGDMKKSYTIGEVKTHTEEEARRTFLQLQHLYGLKLIEGNETPEGQAKTIWLRKDPEKPFAPAVPHTFNFDANGWEKFSPTSAAEIGGVVVGQQYNGVSITPERGFVADRTDGLVENVMNATEGSYIQARTSADEPFKKVFFVNEFGQLSVAGEIRGSTIHLGGQNNENGLLIVYGPDGDPVVQLSGDQKGFDDLYAGNFQAPNVVSYGDFTGTQLEIYVASEAVNGIEPDDNNENPYSWASPIRTIGEALRRIPRYFRGNVKIKLAYGHVFNESIEINGFAGGGTLTIVNDAGHNPIIGNIVITRNLIKINLERIRLSCTASYGAVQVVQSAVSILNSYINGAVGGTDFGIVALDGSSVGVTNSQINNVSIAGRASYGGVLTAINCTGSVSDYAWQAYEGGIVTGYGSAPTGGIGNTMNLRGVLTGTWDFPAPPTPPAPTPVTSTDLWEAETSSGTWRDDFDRWDLSSGQNYVGKVAQGSYSVYGPFTGAWFFPSDLWNTLSGKTIKQIRIFISRSSGGVNASQTAVIRPHTYSARPAGKPSLGSLAVNSGISVGQGKWITLPSSFHAGFANGSSKGFGINGGQYMVFGNGAKIEVTYE